MTKEDTDPLNSTMSNPQLHGHGRAPTVIRAKPKDPLIEFGDAYRQYRFNHQAFPVKLSAQILDNDWTSLARAIESAYETHNDNGHQISVTAAWAVWGDENDDTNNHYCSPPSPSIHQPFPPAGRMCTPAPGPVSHITYGSHVIDKFPSILKGEGWYIKGSHSALHGRNLGEMLELVRHGSPWAYVVFDYELRKDDEKAKLLLTKPVGVEMSCKILNTSRKY